MQDNPYTFDEKNPRLVKDCKRSDYLLPAAGLIFAKSVHMFYKKRFRVDQNAVNFLGFTAGAVPASFVFASTVFGDSEVEAGLLNNERELGH